jgi:Lipid A 3-O-deacylase (PagL)
MPRASALFFVLASAQAAICPHVDGPRSDFQFFAGYSPESLTLIGTVADREFVFAGLTYSYLCKSWNHASVSFTTGAMPAAIVVEPSHAVYGFGITPVGATFHFAPRHTVHPFLEIGLGVIASTEPIPINALDATGLNFLVVAGAGARWKNLSFGYKFVHISNAFTTDFNPGLDNGVFYAGYSLVR